MKNFFNHLRIYILRGLLAIIPLLLCVTAIRLLYILIDKQVMKFLAQYHRYTPDPGFRDFTAFDQFVFYRPDIQQCAGPPDP